MLGDMLKDHFGADSIISEPESIQSFVFHNKTFFCYSIERKVDLKNETNERELRVGRVNP